MENIPNHYRVLQPVHTHTVGDTVPADSFPVGTDFDRLVKLGVVHPCDGTPVPVDENDTEGWKNRALEAERALEEYRAGTPKPSDKAAIENLRAEVTRLNSVIDDQKIEMGDQKADYERRLKELGDPGIAISNMKAELDAAKAEILELKNGSDPEGEQGQGGAQKATEDDSAGGSTPAPPATTEVDQDVVTKLMGLSAPAIDAKIAELGVTVAEGANKMAKARALAAAGFKGE